METLPKIFADVIATGKATGCVFDRFATPWSRGDYCYATTGSIIIVRMKAGPELLALHHRTPDQPKPVDPESIVWEVGDYQDGPLALPAEPAEAEAEAVKIPCEDCGGTGECPRCGEPGNCDECDGEGTWEVHPEPVTFSGVTLKACIVRLLQDHGATVYARKGKKPDRVRFVCGNVEGVAMTITTNET